VANFVFNVALGRIAELAEAGDLRLLVLQAASADAVLKDLDDVAAVLADGGTTEATFTNYARVTLTNVVVTVDDATDEARVTCDDVTFTEAGGASNNTTTDVIIYLHDAGGDASSIPLVQLDAVFTTDGNDVTLRMHEDGFFGAS
jgi:hypothetical protein